MEGGKLKNIILYYLLESIKELGIDPKLLFRRITETASKDIDYLSKEFFSDKMDVKNFENLVNDLSQMLKNEGLIDAAEINFSDNEVNLIISNCKYFDMAVKAKGDGQKSCPICLISLAASIASTIVEAHSFNTSEYETDFDKKVCRLKITYNT